MRFPFLDRIFRRELEDEVLKLRREVLALRQRTASHSRVPGGHEPLLVVARALRDAESPEEFGRAAVAAAVASLGAARGGLVVERDGELEVLAAHDQKAPLSPEAFVWSRSIAKLAASEGNVVATGRAAEDSRFRAHASVVKNELESVLALPLPRSGERAPKGCLYLEALKTGFGPLEPATMLALADLIAVGLARLEGEAESAHRARLETVGVAAAAIAHDLRSPLASAEFALSVLQPQNKTDAKTVEKARTALARARDLSAGLVALATGRERPLEKKKERLAEVIEEAAKLLADELKASEVKLGLELDREVFALVDRSALLRVLDNLVRNAERALAETGGRIEIACRAADGQAEIAVADSGPGIPREELERLFQLGTRTRPGGLGLVLVRELVLALGGKLEVASEGGTRVRVVLPRA